MGEQNFSGGASGVVVRREADGAGGGSGAAARGRDGFGRRVATAMGIILLASGLALVLWYARELLLLAFAGTLLAVVISGPVDDVARRHHMPRPAALAIVLAALLLILGTGGYLMGNNIAHQVSELQQTIPDAFASFRNNMSMSEHPVGQWLIDQTPLVQTYLTSSNSLKQLQGFVSSTFGVLGNLIVVFFVTIFLLFEPKLYIDGLVRLVPMARRARARLILDSIGRTLRWWSIAQLCSMTAVGLLTAGGLALLHVPLAGTLGVIAGLLNCIPNFGPIVAAIPGVLIAFAPSAGVVGVQPTRAVSAIILYLAVQSFDGMFMTPMIQRRAVALPPALVLVFQFLLTFLVGPLGLILATPCLVTLMVLVKMIYLEDVLGDHAGLAPRPRPELPTPVRAGAK